MRCSLKVTTVWSQHLLVTHQQNINFVKVSTIFITRTGSTISKKTVSPEKHKYGSIYINESTYKQEATLCSTVKMQSGTVVMDDTFLH